MKRIHILSAMLFMALTNLISAQNHTWQWATQANGVLNNGFNEPVISPVVNGYFYMVGNFQGASFTFGNTTLTEPDTFNNLFLGRYNVAGDLIWVKGFSAHTSP